MKDNKKPSSSKKILLNTLLRDFSSVTALIMAKLMIGPRKEIVIRMRNRLPVEK
jgi:hypothetical protein